MSKENLQESFSFKLMKDWFLRILAPYTSKVKALAELIHNGIDSAYRRNVNPIIEIRYWQIGEHPLTKNHPGISVLDNGTGFTPEVIAMYMAVGKSFSKSNVKMQGALGTGKFSGLALTRKVEEAVYRIISSTGPNEKPKEAIVSMEKIYKSFFEKDIFSFAPLSTKYPGLPEKGPYAAIFVQDINTTIKWDEVFADLAYEIPFNPSLKLIINGKEVKSPEVDFQQTISPEVPFLGKVKIEIGYFRENDQDKIIKRNEIVLVDALNNRSVCPLYMLKSSLKRILLDPRIHGRIWVNGISKQTSESRNGLKEDYLLSEEGKELVDLLNGSVAKLIHRVLEDLEGTSSPNESQCVELIKKAQPMLWEIFGKPEGPFPPGNINDWVETPEKPEKDPNVNGRGPDKKKRKRRGPRPENEQREDREFSMGTLVQFEGEVYEVSKMAAAGDVPARVIEATGIKRIFLKPNHPWYIKYCMTKNEHNNLLNLARILLEAHVSFTRTRDGKSAVDAFESLYTLLDPVVKYQKKEGKK